MLILFDAFLKLLYSFVHVSQEDILDRISQRLDYDSRNSQPNPVASLTLSITGNHILHFMWYLTGIRMQNRMAFGIGRNCESWDEIRHLYSFAKKLALKISSSEQYFKRARRIRLCFDLLESIARQQTRFAECHQVNELFHYHLGALQSAANREDRFDFIELHFVIEQLWIKAR